MLRNVDDGFFAIICCLGFTKKNFRKYWGGGLYCLTTTIVVVSRCLAFSLVLFH
jgi:hypothetical protein